MTTTQRPRPPRQAPPGPNPASRGLILVVVAVLLGAILLFKGGGIGSQTDATDVEIGTGGGGETTETTAPEVTTPSSSVAPAALQVVVLNAAGENGFAAKGAAFLNLAGYPNVGAETAAAPAASTAVYFAPGYEGDAQAIAGLLSVGTVQPMPDPATMGKAAADVPPTTNVVVVLGPDVKPVIDAATTAPTTTVAPAAGSAGGGTATASTIPPGGGQTTTTKG